MALLQMRIIPTNHVVTRIYHTIHHHNYIDATNPIVSLLPFNDNENRTTLSYVYGSSFEKPASTSTTVLLLLIMSIPGLLVRRKRIIVLNT